MTGACAITGLGVISPVGSSVDAYWRGLEEAERAPDRVELGAVAACGASAPFYGSVRSELGPSPEGWSASTWMARAAILQALRDAQLTHGEGGAELALVIGTAAGEIDRIEEGGFARERDGAFRGAALLAAELGVRGPVVTVSNACAASAYACLCAREILRAGEASAVVVCGVDGLSRTTLASFQRLLVVDDERCRPFDAARSGTVLGDGAAALVLERQPVEKRAYATLGGIGVSCDAHHPTAPREDGIPVGRALEDALRDAGATAGDVAVVVPHGTGTRLNDEVESRVLRRALGERAGAVPVFPVKAKIGHGGGAAGAFSVLTLALILHHRRVPPLLRCAPDPGCPVHLPLASPAPLDGRSGVVNACAFGGSNISLLLEEAP